MCLQDAHVLAPAASEVFPAVDVIQVTVEGISPAAADWRGSLVSEKNFIA